VAFPLAHGVILTSLYLPVTLMLTGLILRGVAFDFRVKAGAKHKPAWDRAFFGGSLLAATSQGVMLGQLVTGFRTDAWAWAFALGIGLGLAGGYALLGAGWLIMKTEQALQRRAVRWARNALYLTAGGIAAVSLTTPLVSRFIHERWFRLEMIFALLPIPLMSAGLVVLLSIFLARLAQDVEQGNDRGLRRWDWAPFTGAVALFVLAFLGLAYSLFPWLVLEEITIWDAASSPESLRFILIGAVVVVPTILAYTAFVYRIFRGKAEPLAYD
ncbi:MAG: cytochrome d ubiquinol oxidase subunit II, partial [Oceanococcaceae bacterium]